MSEEGNGTIVPAFDSATQISEREALRHRIERIADIDARRVCNQQLAYADEHISVARRSYWQAEQSYVDKKLKLDPVFELTLGSGERTYDERVAALRNEYARTPDGYMRSQRAEERRQRLWDNLVQTVAREEEKTRDPELSRDQFMKDRSREPLKRTYRRSIGR